MTAARSKEKVISRHTLHQPPQRREPPSLQTGLFLASRRTELGANLESRTLSPEERARRRSPAARPRGPWPATPPGLTSPRAPRRPGRPPAPRQQLHHQEQAQRAPPRPPRRHRPPADGCLSENAGRRRTPLEPQEPPAAGSSAPERSPPRTAEGQQRPGAEPTALGPAPGGRTQFA